METQEQNPIQLRNSSDVREAASVQAQIVSAKKFPRDEHRAIEKIMSSCKRPGVAKSSQYLYPRGGQTVEGPSIRLAEEIARAWGNIEYGIAELEKEEERTLVESFCIDLETNVRSSRKFWVGHEITLKNKQVKKLTDSRDIYELAANYGSRRLRSCIQAIIPKDIFDEAIATCNMTLRLLEDGQKNLSLEDRTGNLLRAFKSVGVSREMIERRIGHMIAEIDSEEIIELGKIFNSIKDGISKRADWFEFSKAESGLASDLNELVKAVVTDNDKA